MGGSPTINATDAETAAETLNEAVAAGEKKPEESEKDGDGLCKECPVSSCPVSNPE